MNSSLPKPSKSGMFELDDGSRIYPSGSPDHPVHPGSYFIWIKDGERPGKTAPVAFGHIVMTKDSIRYFNSAQAALEELQSGRLTKEQSARS